MPSEPLNNDFFTAEPPVGRWSDEEFHRRRALVLDQWPTGEDLRDLDANVAYAAALPDHKRLPTAVRRARDAGVPLFQCGIGHTTPAEQLDHMSQAADAGVDMILTLTDTYTRKSKYGNSQTAVDRALASDETLRLLNGFPIVNYGVEQTRQVWEQIPVPVHISGNVDEAAMLTSETAYASGATCDFTHSLHDLIQHSRDYPIERRVQNDQYISRLAGHYTANGAPIEMLTLANYQGLIPPALGMAVAILSMLRSAEQGVKHFSLHRCIEGCLVQDVAAFDVYPRIAQEYADRLGFEVDLVKHSWPWMGAWPANEAENAALVSWCTSISMLAGVDWIYLKSVHEGVGIPDVESNLASIHIARELRRIVPRQAVLQSDGVREEAELIERELRCLLDAALEAGDGDPSRAEIQAVKRGLLDIPMSAWQGVTDKVVAARDSQGAVRYLETGDLPLPKDIVDYHRQKLEARMEKDNVTREIQLVIDDVRSYMSDPEPVA